MNNANTHHVKTDMGDVEFMMIANSEGTYQVRAPGVCEFTVENLSEARDILRGAYFFEDTRDEVLPPEWLERNPYEQQD